ncbi:molybdopterin-guanine dinucleotide biosynthesis protein B [Neobacillus ginsengisoli]|uniref:Molybdopterin-guanine dinucleotide biosynthesis protein B n=1 Tax=Neobacillus ginsengisoli TaxID=904295 RepID=A0ABT9XRZ7_9BACI|nr:molybdopterin-guanine dinucleotide biosynthesis protein B [Neobacillus ginsengisoli]MDQ0198163.1 molybdopterin-guanine dinucleotide biosynthesis protein B [Neobacillus ginsengisoli]
MALVKPVIFQVVGFQNSGKTTVISKLIQTLKEHGLKSVIIKHHGHGGKPEVSQKKDSAMHLVAGAYASIVEGDGRLILQAENSEWDLEEQIKLMEFFQPDVILIEGFKLKNYPKLLLLRESNDLSLLTKVSNVKVIMYWKDELKRNLEEQTNTPFFHIQDKLGMLLTVQSIKKNVQKIDSKS